MRESGFTLMEILVVVVIVGLLASLAGRHIWVAEKEAEIRLTFAKCQQIHDVCHIYRMRTGHLPRCLEEIQVPLSPGEPRLLDPCVDPWGGPYRLEAEPVLRICSSGPDRAEGTADDICYEPREE